MESREPHWGPAWAEERRLPRLATKTPRRRSVPVPRRCRTRSAIWERSEPEPHLSGPSLVLGTSGECDCSRRFAAVEMASMVRGWMGQTQIFAKRLKQRSGSRMNLARASKLSAQRRCGSR
ncbi:hypothetical protein PYCCODRAFT_466628 [Trametes coccinea BRFM310]|uniref:Uncharacterized protein n=1 Tax=Trametes coccinea (strain BRFM310) TaxID=1353009 RepID=A0A1Y2IKS2_TRAC3|nr:hypothetical protein PYCCODRAFT_466628 [Trametes coccinea BRFM310]